MTVTCGFLESEEFCPLEKEIREKTELQFFPRSMNAWLKILQFDLYLDYYINLFPDTFIGVGLQLRLCENLKEFELCRSNGLQSEICLVCLP